MLDLTIEIVTPAKAEQWLLNNPSNRPMRTGVAERYAHDMRCGQWTQCVAPIAFYDDSHLADGQHRLWAVVESGAAQRFIIARGLSRADGLNIDTGLLRNLIDNARISGENKHVTTVLLAAAKAIAIGDSKTAKPWSNADQLANLAKYQDAAEFAARTVRRKQGLCGAVILGAVGRAYLAGVDHAKLERFCDVLASGLHNDESETAATAMRNYLMAKAGIHSSTGLWRDTFLKAMNSISYFAQGRKLTVIKAVSEEAYPLKKQRK